MRRWRENGCWSNDAGITSSLLSLRPFVSPSLSRSPSVSPTLLLHATLSFFVCLSSFTSFHHHLRSGDKAESKKNHSGTTLLFSSPSSSSSCSSSLKPRPKSSFVLHEHWMDSPSVEMRNEERHKTTVKCRKTNTKWCKTIRGRCKKGHKKEKKKRCNSITKRWKGLAAVAKTTASNDSQESRDEKLLLQRNRKREWKITTKGCKMDTIKAKRRDDPKEILSGNEEMQGK